jgi:uncharacterized LabA/DUF88 family protein
MDRCAVFVDAGYLFASGAKLLSGARQPRSQLHLDHDRILELLVQKAQQLSGLPLLRVYWYDGASSGPNPAQLALAYRANLKLRLGLVDDGQQRGVDELLAQDLIGLAHHRALADALVLSGDDDLRPAVEQAQASGVRVHLLGIAPARENQAAALVQAADTTHELSALEVGGFLTRRSQ